MDGVAQLAEAEDDRLEAEMENVEEVIELSIKSIRDTVVALSGCSALHSDLQLALVVLAEHGPTSEYGHHLRQGCASD